MINILISVLGQFGIQKQYSSFSQIMPIKLFLLDGLSLKY